jgi:hypothetical protein
MLSIYDLYFTLPSFGDDLFFCVSNAQIKFQFMLVFLLFICLIAKKVDKLVIVKPLLMVVLTTIIALIAHFGTKVIDGNLVFWIIIITLFINIFNSVLIYILSYTAKGKLFK